MSATADLLPEEERRRRVESFFARREELLAAAGRCGSPLYLLDPPALRGRAREFTRTFRSAFAGVELRVYYALKSNSHPGILRRLIEEGLGVDVSSGLELSAALALGARDVVFSGPGKTDDELAQAVKARTRTRVLLDSFAELDRLEAAAARAGATVRAGVRLTTDERGIWRKFGIPLAALPRFWEVSGERPHVRLEGLQFHTSWNLTPAAQVAFLERLGATLPALPAQARRAIAFIDIGGGIWPPEGEWLHRPDGAPLGDEQLAGAVLAQPPTHYRRPAAPIEAFAAALADAWQRVIAPHATCAVCVEPGRWLCHEALHLVLTVIDRKAEDLVITDGGMNAVGWERYEQDYFPILNLSQPDPAERPCLVMGSLCTPHDLWGTSYCGRDIAPGDVLLIPCQGAYTYSLRQEFIKPVPATGELAE